MPYGARTEQHNHHLVDNQQIIIEEAAIIRGEGSKGKRIQLALEALEISIGDEEEHNDKFYLVK